MPPQLTRALNPETNGQGDGRKIHSAPRCVAGMAEVSADSEIRRKEVRPKRLRGGAVPTQRVNAHIRTTRPRDARAGPLPGWVVYLTAEVITVHSDVILREPQ